MKTYSQFIKESSFSTVPVASIATTGTDVSIPKIKNECNRNLSLVLRQSFETISEALNKINKILNMYNLSVPLIDTYDIKDNRIIIPISPKLYWDEFSGEYEPRHTFQLDFSYVLDRGLYTCKAELQDQI